MDKLDTKMFTVSLGTHLFLSQKVKSQGHEAQKVTTEKTSVRKNLFH